MVRRETYVQGSQGHRYGMDCPSWPLSSPFNHLLPVWKASMRLLKDPGEKLGLQTLAISPVPHARNNYAPLKLLIPYLHIPFWVINALFFRLLRRLGPFDLLTL